MYIIGNLLASFSQLLLISFRNRVGMISILSMSLVTGVLLNTITYAMSPTTHIRANGHDTYLSMTTENNLSITIEVDSGNNTGTNADWWVLAYTPFGWYHYDVVTNSWAPDFTVTYQGPLFDLTFPLGILNISNLPAGTYIFYFGVDMIMNGSLDMGHLYYDSVKVNILKPLPNFLIGVGTTDPEGCVPSTFLKKLLANGINYFLAFTSWASIEVSKGDYTGTPCPGEDFISFAKKNGAVLDGHCLVFLMNEPWVIPRFAFGRSYSEQKRMIEDFVKATLRRFPDIEIWTLNEPINQNAFGWSREEVYDLFVSASQWIHDVNPAARVMINMIPIENDWSGLHYEPDKVLDDLFARGLQADIIGIEIYPFFAGKENQDKNGYPTLEWVKEKVNIFRKYGLPIIFSEVSVPGIVDGKEQFSQQADWMEALFRFAYEDPQIIGASWYFVRDDLGFMPYGGLVNSDYSYRKVYNRLIELSKEWNQ